MGAPNVYVVVTPHRPEHIFVFLLVSALILSAPVTCATEHVPWKYALRPGDHLVYHYTIERSYHGDDGQSLTRAQFTNHIVVLGQLADRISIGFQRNREAAELLLYKERGKDKLEQELPKFRERMAQRRAHFSEAMEFNASGEPLRHWEAARETASKLILGIHEVEALPSNPPAVGDSWRGSNLLGISFKLAAREPIGENNCNRVEGADASGTVHLRYWWCDGTGAIEKIEFEGEYSVPGGTVLETARFQLAEKRRGEDLAMWLQSPDVRDAAIRALVLCAWIAVKPESLNPTLNSGDTYTQRLALTYLHQRRPQSFDAETVRPLTNSTDPAVKRLAARLLAEDSTAGAESPQKCAVKDPDFPSQKIGTTVRLISDSKSGTYPYMVRVPDDYRADRKFPLLIYLSGGGGLAIDGVNTADEAIAGTDYLVLYPQAGDHWWTPGIRARVDALLGEVLREFNVDTNRIYIAGFSNGGTGALDFAQLWPQRFAGVVSLMGAGQCNPQVASGLKNLTNLPILFVHGGRDPRIEVACSRETFESLKRLKPKNEPVLHVLEKREHDITLQQDDGLTLPFLGDKTRDPFPAKFSASWQDTSFPRRYWVEVLEKEPGTADVDARVQTGNRIEISTRGVKRLRVLLRHELLSPNTPVTILLNKKKVFERDFQPDCRTLEKSASQAGDPLLGYEQALDFDVGK
jgi:hypothetical protein